MNKNNKDNHQQKEPNRNNPFQEQNKGHENKGHDNKGHDNQQGKRPDQAGNNMPGQDRNKNQHPHTQQKQQTPQNKK